MLKYMEILENLEALGSEVSLELKGNKASRGHRALTASMAALEMLDHEDILETLAEME